MSREVHDELCDEGRFEDMCIECRTQARQDAAHDAAERSRS